MMIEYCQPFQNQPTHYNLSHINIKPYLPYSAFLSTRKYKQAILPVPFEVVVAAVLGKLQQINAGFICIKQIRIYYAHSVGHGWPLY